MADRIGKTPQELYRNKDGDLVPVRPYPHQRMPNPRDEVGDRPQELKREGGILKPVKPKPKRGYGLEDARRRKS